MVVTRGVVRHSTAAVSMRAVALYAVALYHEPGLRGGVVQDSWQGENGALCVLICVVRQRSGERGYGRRGYGREISASLLRSRTEHASRRHHVS